MIISAGLLQNSSLIWLLTAGVALGALHALEPGHAKTMIASFIVATRGTPPQAALLGLSAAISHSLLIWALALGGLYLGDAFIDDDAEPWLQLGSGLLIVGIGLAMAWRQMNMATLEARRDKSGPHSGQLVDTGHGFVEVSVFEDGVPPRFRLYFYDPRMNPIAGPEADAVTLQTVRPDGSAQLFRFVQSVGFVASIVEIPEPHEFEVVVSLSHGDHDHRYQLTFTEHDHHANGHAHHHAGAPEDSHARAHAQQLSRLIGDRSVSTSEIVLFGLSGGLMPCPAALTMLLVCLRLKKIVLGIGLVTAFSLGLAITLVSLGILASIGMAYASRRLSWLSDATWALPFVSSAVVVALGVYMGLSGFTQLAR